ncbi:hypothetical protein [Antrihabitans cavernicola]|uniref:Uncharacterized protein n=1 Tax=Antrihabitans cavernicola TaxID=2495913 RepID=A0A5A7S9A5_9NOCA|nr:hypothetical protein [Spelaeibacter cavernicola]KAA0021819.1 hypothetical protein FOY51_15575 [Spelaeibacter cavernicola]
MTELEELISDTWDAVEFLRAQMFARAKPQDGAAQGDGERQETGREVSTGAKPKSKPPFNLDAMDAADAEVAALIGWADTLGLRGQYRGWVWRVNGVARGVLYDDTRAVRDVTKLLTDWLRAGGNAPDGMLDDIRSVRNTNRKNWPELDVFLERPIVERSRVDDPNQYALSL